MRVLPTDILETIRNAVPDTIYKAGHDSSFTKGAPDADSLCWESLRTGQWSELAARDASVLEQLENIALGGSRVGWTDELATYASTHILVAYAMDWHWGRTNQRGIDVVVGCLANSSRRCSFELQISLLPLLDWLRKSESMPRVSDLLKITTLMVFSSAHNAVLNETLKAMQDAAQTDIGVTTGGAMQWPLGLILNEYHDSTPIWLEVAGALGHQSSANDKRTQTLVRHLRARFA